MFDDNLKKYLAIKKEKWEREERKQHFSKLLHKIYKDFFCLFIHYTYKIILIFWWFFVLGKKNSRPLLW